MALDYTIWFNDADPAFDYMWSLETTEGRTREAGAEDPEMFAPLIKEGVTHAFTLLKQKHPFVSEAKRVHDIVTIFGTNKSVDLMNNVVNRPVFERRTITESFVLLVGHAAPGDYYVERPDEWEQVVSGVVNYLNTIIGDVRIVLSADRGFYWKGTVSAKIKEKEKFRAIVEVTANVEPFKYERYASNEPWIWDDFSFIDGIIREEYGYVELDVTHQTASFAVPVRSGDIIPRFRAHTEDGTPEDFRNLNTAIGTLQNDIDGAIEDETTWNSTLLTTINNHWIAAQTNYSTLENDYYTIPDWQNAASRFDTILFNLTTDISAATKDRHAIRYDLNAAQTALVTIERIMTMGMVCASIDYGVTWHSVGFDELKSSPDVVLAGSYQTGLYTRQPIINRSLMLRGAVPVTVSIRGTAL